MNYAGSNFICETNDLTVKRPDCVSNYLKVDFRSEKNNTCSSVLHNHTVLMK